MTTGSASGVDLRRTLPRPLERRSKAEAKQEALQARDVPTEHEGLKLHLNAQGGTGYKGVAHNRKHDKPGPKHKPFKAQAKCGNRMKYLGSFATAEEAALCYARHVRRLRDEKAAAAAATAHGGNEARSARRLRR